MKFPFSGYLQIFSSFSWHQTYRLLNKILSQWMNITMVRSNNRNIEENQVHMWIFNRSERTIICTYTINLFDTYMTHRMRGQRHLLLNKSTNLKEHGHSDHLLIHRLRAFHSFISHISSQDSINLLSFVQFHSNRSA